MADKETKLSIVIRTVDKATAKIKAISDRLDAATKPLRDFKEALGDLREKSGLDAVISGFGGVGGAIAGVLDKVAMVGGVVGAAVAGLFHLVDGFDELGDKAEAAGVSVDFLASTRYAAERSGAAVEQLDAGIQGLASSLGQARAGTGKMASFLKEVSPALLRQVKAAKDNESAFNLLADAAAKLTDKAKLAAFAQKTLGDASLAPLLAKGSKGIKELRDEYIGFAGSQQGAADAAGEVDDGLKKFKATTDGIKAALVQGLAPALGVIVEQLRAWLQGSRGQIAEFAASLGKRIPDAVQKLVGVFSGVVETIRPFVDSTTKLKVIAAAVAAIIVGPLVASIYSLGVALLTTPVGWIVAGIAAIAAGAYLLIKNWDSVTAWWKGIWDKFGGVLTVALPFIVVPIRLIVGLVKTIIEHWEPIKDFFVTLWDGITGAFRAAWDIIKEIVDNITGAVDAVTGAVGDVIDAINPFSDSSPKVPGSDLFGTIERALPAAQPQAAGAHVTVDFANAPRGTRASVAPQSTASVDLSVGYQMGLTP